MKKQYIIPIFVPHLGCPNECTFCNQKKISGQLKPVTESDVRETIEYYLSNFKDKDTYKEIAFFGGSFTGIDVETQNKLLDVAFDYVKEKKVDGIRILDPVVFISEQENINTFGLIDCSSPDRILTVKCSIYELRNRPLVN